MRLDEHGVHEGIPSSFYRKIIDSIVIAVVDILLVNSDEKYILGKRIHEPLKGVLWMPGGRMKKRESFPFALKRILKDEVGIDALEDAIVGPVVQLNSYAFSHPYDTMPNRTKDVSSTVFLVNVCAGAVLNLSDQHDCFGAYGEEEILDFHPDLRSVIQDHQYYLKHGKVPNEIALK